MINVFSLIPEHIREKLTLTDDKKQILQQQTISQPKFREMVTEDIPSLCTDTSSKTISDNTQTGTYNCLAARIRRIDSTV